MVIRKALNKDVKSIVDINIQGWKETYREIFPNNFLESLENKRKDSMDKCISKINEYIVCEIEDKVVGFLRCGKNKKGYNEKYAEVYALYINSQYKKKGIGRKLLKYSFDVLKNNYENVLVSTLQENTANEFYKKCGGIQIDTCSFNLGNNEYQENLYLFKLD